MKFRYFMMMVLALSAGLCEAQEMAMRPEQGSIREQDLQRIARISPSDITLVRRLTDSDIVQLGAMQEAQRAKQAERYKKFEAGAQARDKALKQMEERAHGAYKNNKKLYQGLLNKAKSALSQKSPDMRKRLAHALKGAFDPQQIAMLTELITSAVDLSAWSTDAALTKNEKAQEKLWQEWMALQRAFNGKMKPFELAMEEDPALTMTDNTLILVGLLLSGLESESTAFEEDINKK